MGRRPTGKRPKNQPFAMVPWHLLNSTAYRELSHAAAKVLPVFLGKPKINLGNGQAYEHDFTFTYKEAVRLGLAPATFSRALRNLIALGFVDPVDKGGLRGCGRSCSKFKLSRRWQAYGTSDFKEVSWSGFEPKLN